MNSGVIGWIVVRDHSKNVMYQGYLTTFSTTEDPRELILRDATVFENSSGAKLYDVSSLYLSLEKKNVVVEIF
jgi:peptidyl-tRNA hydrolase